MKTPRGAECRESERGEIARARGEKGEKGEKRGEKGEKGEKRGEKGERGEKRGEKGEKRKERRERREERGEKREERGNDLLADSAQNWACSETGCNRTMCSLIAGPGNALFTPLWSGDNH